MSLSPRDRLRRLASFYEDQVGRSRADQIAAAAMLRARPVRQHRRALVAATSMAATVVGLIGLGAISDEALPGQVLYPVDRAYESVAAFVGVNTGPGEERLVEALALLDLGRDLDALRAVDEALTVLGDETGVEDWVVAVSEGEVRTPVTAPSGSVAPPTTQPGPSGATPTAEATVVAAEAPDASSSLRLATEFLLQTVRAAKTPSDSLEADDAVVTLRAAASEVAAAAESVKAEAAQAMEDGSTTTTVPAGSTSTTVPGGSTSTTMPAGSTSTTLPDGSTTTTTTVPDGSTSTTVPGGSTTTTVPGGSTTTTVPGPIIILPPQP